MTRRTGPAPRRRAPRVSAAPLVLSAALLVAAASVPRPLPAQESGVVAVADEAAGGVSVLDMSCWGVAARLHVDGRVTQVAPAPGTLRAYVAHDRPAAAGIGGLSGGDGSRRSGNGSPGADGEGSVTVLSMEERRAVRRFDLGRTGTVTDVWGGHEGGRLWVATERDGRVLTLASGTGELLMEWTIGRTSHQSGAVSRDDRYLFVTNREAGTLTVIDRVTVAANTVELDSGVGAVAVGRGGEAWVADRDGDRLWVVEPKSGRVLAEFPSGGSGPVQLVARPGAHEMWVLHGGGGGVQVFDTYRREKAGAVTLPGSPRALRFSPDGERALVTVPGRELVVTVDAAQRAVASTVRVPLSPGALAWASCPDGRCGLDASRRRPGPAGLPGGHWSDADLVGDLWCGD